MWPFLFILILVPLIFFWSDSVRALFPSLSDWLPEESKTVVGVYDPANPNALPEAAKMDPLANQWLISDTEKGYVAWTLSSDKKYRLAVGCYPGAPATLQVTLAQGGALQKMLTLNYQYGLLALDQGHYVGSELVGSVAQFSQVYLQSPSGAVLAQFNVPGYVSGAVAREVQSACPSY